MNYGKLLKLTWLTLQIQIRIQKQILKFDKVTQDLNRMVSARIVGFVNFANTIPAMQA